jgi:hypothetical protein
MTTLRTVPEATAVTASSNFHARDASSQGAADMT